MDESVVYQNIVEVLVFSQFAHWIDLLPDTPTAEQVNTQNKRAMSYYWGEIEDEDEEAKREKMFAANRFRALVGIQAAKIIQAIT